MNEYEYFAVVESNLARETDVLVGKTVLMPL